MVPDVAPELVEVTEPGVHTLIVRRVENGWSVEAHRSDYASSRTYVFNKGSKAGSFVRDMTKTLVKDVRAEDDLF